MQLHEHRPRLRSRFHVIVALATAVALVGCGGGISDDTSEPTETTVASTDTTDTTDTTSPTEPLATVTRIDASVDARIDTASDFTAINEPAGVNPGDEVRTDNSGFAEIAYFDGSITRLDIATDFTVVDLTNDTDTATIRTTMGTGRTWHRVEELTGDDTYEVTTSVATATVRGTAFIITCPDDTTCDFTVLDGTVDITPLDGEPITVEANETITITTDQTPDAPAPIDPDLLADPWIIRNEGLDTDAGQDILDIITDGGAAGGAASPEFCAAWKGVAGLLFLEGIRAQLSEVLPLAPEDLQPAVQELLALVDAVDPSDPAPDLSAAAPIFTDIDAFVAENCAPIIRPTFAFERSERSGNDWVFFFTGVCSDGSFPVDVVGPITPWHSHPAATDLGNGDYSVEYTNLQPSATEELLLIEIDIPGSISGTCV